MREGEAELERGLSCALGLRKAKCEMRRWRCEVREILFDLRALLVPLTPLFRTATRKTSTLRLESFVSSDEMHWTVWSLDGSL